MDDVAEQLIHGFLQKLDIGTPIVYGIKPVVKTLHRYYYNNNNNNNNIIRKIKSLLQNLN